MSNHQAPVANPEHELRVSIDYNDTLNGDRERRSRQQDRIDPESAEAIKRWLKRSPSHRVGICSYIGVGGPKSQEKRNSLKTQVKLLHESQADCMQPALVAIGCP